MKGGDESRCVVHGGHSDPLRSCREGEGAGGGVVDGSGSTDFRARVERREVGEVAMRWC